MKAFFCVMAMLTVSPVLAVTTLVYSHSDRWSKSGDLLSILAMSVFGVLTTPLWPTYIPTIVFGPSIMRQIATHRAFKTLPLPAILGISLLVGALAGVCVMGPIIFASLQDSGGSPLDWVCAGAVSGGLTLALVSLIYRYEPRSS
jgi:hypothetical protein